MLGRKKVRAKCSECLETSDLKICMACNCFLCGKDRKLHIHPVFFSSRSTIIYCIQCSRRYLADGLVNNQKKTVDVRIPMKMYKLIPYTPIKGLSNLGNSCYMNAVLVILLNLDPIRRDFLSENHERVSCGNKRCIICSMKSLFQDLYSPGYVMTHKFIYNFWLAAPQFLGFKQHDAHDFFISLLHNLHEAYNLEKVDEAVCKCLSHQTFFGLLSSVISCNACGFCKETEDPFISIPLECSSSILSSLDKFFKSEILTDKITCTQCEEGTYWSKKVRIKRYPEILSLHLKRFSYDTVARKIDCDMFLPDSLTIDGNFYCIFGFVNHSGAIDYGHYFSYVLLDNTWYRIDDENVCVIPSPSIPRDGSYIVYYIHKKTS